MEYKEFLEQKQKAHILSGFDAKNINPMLFDFQEFIVKRALKAGKYAIFADCGLGKTPMQLEWSHKVYEYTGKPVLILAPLAVSGQTIKEGIKFNIPVVKYPFNGTLDLLAPIYISNYEQLDNIDFALFSGIVLDESSILKNFEGAIKTKLIELCKEIPYKLCCTATPSPNDPMEMGNHSEFLDIMSRNEMLAMYFVHDGGDTAKWRIKGHAVEKFYEWIGQWAIMLNKPLDIGFENKGFDLPKLNFIEKQIKTPKRDNGLLFNDAIVNATNFNAELRLTKEQRMKEVAELVNNSDENFIIWVKQNEEGVFLKNLIPDSTEVKGSDSSEFKENKLLGFANNEFRVLITKSKIAQFGLNYQNCRNQIFASLDFSFESLYQSIRRSYRFGQKNEVNIYLITTDTMSNVNQAIKNKEKQFKKMQDLMSKAINVNLKQEYMKVNLDNEKIETPDYLIQRGDCVQLIKQVKDNSVGFAIFSPPFASLYTYSSHIEDMGNSKDYNEFVMQFGFLVKELFRVISEGRNVCVHCMDLPIQKGKEGFIGLRDFSGMIRETFEKEGFIYHSRITIWKDPVVEMQRTKALGLLHKQTKKDSTMCRVGLPDYILVFRKDGERSNPVKLDMNVDLWQKLASPVWFDINQSDTLQRESARDEKDEKHICPLQLEVIKRCLFLYTNEGDTVLTPFMGIGSEAYEALKYGRKAIGFELKESYFNQAKKNIANVILEKRQLKLI